MKSIPFKKHDNYRKKMKGWLVAFFPLKLVHLRSCIKKNFNRILEIIKKCSTDFCGRQVFFTRQLKHSDLKGQQHNFFLTHGKKKYSRVLCHLHVSPVILTIRTQFQPLFELQIILCRYVHSPWKTSLLSFKIKVPKFDPIYLIIYRLAHSGWNTFHVHSTRTIKNC